MNDETTLPQLRVADSPQPPQPAAYLIRVLDYDAPTMLGSRHLLDGVFEVDLGRSTTPSYLRAGSSLHLGVPDQRMSSRHARLTPEVGSCWGISDLQSLNGTFVDGARTARARLGDNAWIELGRTAFLFRIFEQVPPADVFAAELSGALHGLTTLSPSFEARLRELAEISATSQALLLRGEPGTGKEVLARGVHEVSKRTGAFVTVDCGAEPDGRLEGELRSAEGGTLFLDGIGDPPLRTQTTLLRVIQDKALDVRVIAASHRDPQQEGKDGRFREGLLARLGGFVFEVPSLRERREDLGLLIASLLWRMAARAIRFSPEAGRALVRYRWPGNIRELEQALGAALSESTTGTIEIDHLPPALRRPPTAT